MYSVPYSSSREPRNIYTMVMGLQNLPDTTGVQTREGATALDSDARNRSQLKSDLAALGVFHRNEESDSAAKRSTKAGKRSTETGVSLENKAIVYATARFFGVGKVLVCAKCKFAFISLPIDGVNSSTRGAQAVLQIARTGETLHISQEGEHTLIFDGSTLRLINTKPFKSGHNIGVHLKP